MTTSLRDLLEAHVSDGAVPGAVALLARGEQVEVQAVGAAAVGGAVPMARDSIFRIASITKPITAAAVMMLVDDVVPAVRPITVLDLLTSRAGYGWPSDFSLPAVQMLFDIEKDVREDEWLARLARVPLLHQPGEAWLYDTCSDLQGVLVARASGQSLPEFFAERILEPLGMADTGFEVPAVKRDRLTSAYRPVDGGLEPADAPDEELSDPPVFASGSGGLVSTADDWHRFARLLLGGGTLDGRRLLSAESVRQMTTNHLTADQRAAGELFLEGQGWGFGGSVDDEAIDPWNVPGRYGWVGGTGTTAHIVPSTGTVAILLTQVSMTSPVAPAIMRDFWRHAA